METVVIGIGAWAVIKVCDALASIVHMLRLPPGASGEDRSWTPMFGFGTWLSKPVKREREAKGKKPEGGFLNLLVFLIFDLLFRAPVIGVGGGIVVLLAIGSIHESQSGAHAKCVLQPVASVGTLYIATAAALVMATMAVLTSFLQGGTQEAAGHVVRRSTSNENEQPKKLKKTMSPALVVLSMIVALIVSFAALYAASVGSNGAGIEASPCRFNMADAVYFSASVGATAGFGDISPTSSMLRLVTSVQLIIFVAAVAIFLQMLWARPEKENPKG